jgi:non-ribosomal peptide synthetase component F
MNTPAARHPSLERLRPERPSRREHSLSIEDHTLGETLQSLGRRLAAQGVPGYSSEATTLSSGLAYAGSRLLLRLAYGHQTLDDDAASRMLGHWRAVLMGVMTHAHGRVVDLPMLTDAERALMHVGGNNTQRQHCVPSCLHELFEAQVMRTPAAAALRLEEETVAYDDLNARANRLARYLQDIGVGPESLVAICMPRSPALIAALLAVLKSGGVYLPIDPDYPREQIASMLEDSHASVVLTESKLPAPCPVRRSLGRQRRHVRRGDRAPQRGQPARVRLIRQPRLRHLYVRFHRRPETRRRRTPERRERHCPHHRSRLQPRRTGSHTLRGFHLLRC